MLSLASYENGVYQTPVCVQVHSAFPLSGPWTLILSQVTAEAPPQALRDKD